MTCRADALILLDNPTALRKLTTVTSACGLDTMATRSPGQAIRLLREHDPTLAVLDWNMRPHPDAERVLAVLSHHHPGTYTIVYASNPDTDVRLRDRVAAHPFAWAQDRREGLDSLMRRVCALLQRQVADLRIDRGTVVHVPTGLATRTSGRCGCSAARRAPRWWAA